MSCVSTLNERRSKSKASKWKLCKLKILSNNREKPDKKDNDRLEDEKEVEKGSFGFEFFWVTNLSQEVNKRDHKLPFDFERWVSCSIIHIEMFYLNTIEQLFLCVEQ